MALQSVGAAIPNAQPSTLTKPLLTLQSVSYYCPWHPFKPTDQITLALQQVSLYSSWHYFKPTD
jgi:hypothetical protein